MKTLLVTTLLAATVLATPALAQQANDHAAHHPTASDMADGEIRKVDKEAAKLTIKHGEIKSLDMPAMTMVFQVKDAAVLDKVKAGDKVRFKASNEGGKFTITDLQVVR